MNTRNAQRQFVQPVVVESLEDRRLLSASMHGGGGGGRGAEVATATLNDGALVVNGTRGADLIVVAMNYADPSGAPKVDVAVNDAVVGSFFLRDVTQGVQVNAGKGDDTVRFDESAGLVPLGLRAFGGHGDDTLVGSFLDDELYGGSGDDALHGNDGNDALFGDQGADLLAGGGGDDLADGGHGADEIYGEAGADALAGGHGYDRLDGGDGDDSLDGGCGADALAGGTGADLFASTDRATEILDKADEDTHEPARPGKRHGGHGRFA